MGEYINGYDYGLSEKELIGKDLTIDYLRNENITSLNNFIRYGSYSHGRDHVLTKNKSIADILLLSDSQVVILVNFIELCRLNKDLIYNSVEDYNDDLFNKFLVSIQLAPNNLPMYFNYNNLDEEVFYYQLIRSLLKWIISYQSFCSLNGYNKLYTIGISDVTTFNGKLKEIADIMSEYLIKVKLVYPFDLEKKEVKKEMTKDEIKEMIKREVEEERKRGKEDCCPHDSHHKKPYIPAHKKHNYDFEHSGFNCPTLIKMRFDEHESHHHGREQVNKALTGNMIYCDESAINLIKKMDDYDFLYLPKMVHPEKTKEHLVFSNLHNITIVGANTEMYYTMEFEDTSVRIQNLTIDFDKKAEEPVKTAIKLSGESFVSVEDCVYNNFEKVIDVPNDDSYSKADINFIDSICYNCFYGIVADSPLAVRTFRASFVNDKGIAIKVVHSNNNKTIVTINDTKFYNCGDKPEEEIVVDNGNELLDNVSSDDNDNSTPENPTYSIGEVVDDEDDNDENEPCAIRLINNKISSRVGITAAYIIDSIFVNNKADIIVGSMHQDITNVDLKTQNNIGLNTIINLSEKEVVDDGATDSEIGNNNDIINEETLEQSMTVTHL